MLLTSSIRGHLLSLKFRLHMATRTPHHQNSNEVTHGTELIHSTPEGQKTIQSNQKLKGALHQLDARTCAGQKRVLRACAPDARLSTQKAAHLLIRRINCIGRPLDRLQTGPQGDLTLKSESALQKRRIK
jgi:Na+-translocating ferredoxin:NAD+ oxidoreductase RNF subunit RnfB